MLYNYYVINYICKSCELYINYIYIYNFPTTKEYNKIQRKWQFVLSSETQLNGGKIVEILPSAFF